MQPQADLVSEQTVDIQHRLQFKFRVAKAEAVTQDKAAEGLRMYMIPHTSITIPADLRIGYQMMIAGHKEMPDPFGWLNSGNVGARN